MKSERVLTYHVRKHVEDDGSMWATVDELPGCLATGDTETELLQSLQEGISLYLSTPHSRIKVFPIDSQPVNEVTEQQWRLVDA